MAHEPLVLTAEQNALVAFTGSLPPRWRQRFNNAVADLLTPHPNPTNAEVTAAVSAAKRAIVVVLWLPKQVLPESVGCFKNASGTGYICSQ